jgi:hypothetical protein
MPRRTILPYAPGGYPQPGGGYHPKGDFSLWGGCWLPHKWAPPMGAVPWLRRCRSNAPSGFSPCLRRWISAARARMGRAGNGPARDGQAQGARLRLEPVICHRLGLRPPGGGSLTSWGGYLSNGGYLVLHQPWHPPQRGTILRSRLACTRIRRGAHQPALEPWLRLLATAAADMGVMGAPQLAERPLSGGSCFRSDVRGSRMTGGSRQHSTLAAAGVNAGDQEVGKL